MLANTFFSNLLYSQPFINNYPPLNRLRYITMDIAFYKSTLCPRCYLAGKHLKKALLAYPQVTLREIDLFTDPKLILRDGIRMIPALKINDQVLSSFYLSRNKIEQFLAEQCGSSMMTIQSKI